MYLLNKKAVKPMGLAAFLHEYYFLIKSFKKLLIGRLSAGALYAGRKQRVCFLHQNAPKKCIDCIFRWQCHRAAKCGFNKTIKSFY